MKEKARLKAERVIGCVFIIIDLFLISAEGIPEIKEGGRSIIINGPIIKRRRASQPFTRFALDV